MRDDRAAPADSGESVDDTSASQELRRQAGVAPDDIRIRDFDAYFEDLAQEAAREVPSSGPVSVGITVQIDGIETSVACSDAWASELDEIQYEVDRGPCLHSLRTQSLVQIDDVNTDPHWPGWRERAMAAGVGSSLSAPILADNGPRGAMNFYSSTPRAFDESSVERATEMARRAIRGIVLVAWMVEQERYIEQIRAALGSRSVIDQALGIIMGQNRCTSEDAFLILRKASQNRNMKLRQVAAEIVTAATGRAPVPPPLVRDSRMA